MSAVTGLSHVAIVIVPGMATTNDMHMSSRSKDRALGLIILLVFTSIVLLSAGSYCVSDSSHCSKDRYGRTYNSIALGSSEIAFGILALFGAGVAAFRLKMAS